MNSRNLGTLLLLLTVGTGQAWSSVGEGAQRIIDDELVKQTLKYEACSSTPNADPQWTDLQTLRALLKIESCRYVLGRINARAELAKLWSMPLKMTVEDAFSKLLVKSPLTQKVDFYTYSIEIFGYFDNEIEAITAEALIEDLIEAEFRLSANEEIYQMLTNNGERVSAIDYKRAQEYFASYHIFFATGIRTAVQALNEHHGD